MNELIIPPSPLWYKSNIMACAPDNTLLYGAQCDIVIISEAGSSEPSEIRFITPAHNKRLVSINLNRKWGDPHKYAVSLGEDNVIKVWDIDTLKVKYSNTDHIGDKEIVVGAVFAGSDRIVSTTPSGHVIVWNTNTNESNHFKNLFNFKVSITCLSSCPHASWLVAFGLFNGCVVVTDLRRNGTLLYKLRGHDKAVVSLSWCPAPVNVFPRYIRNTVKNKTEPSDEIANTPSIAPKPCVWSQLTHADDDLKQPATSINTLPEPDFLQQCNQLKNKILGEPDADEVSSEDNISTEIKDSDEKDTQTEKNQVKFKEVYVNRNPDEGNGRPLPIIYDQSCDFEDFIDNEIAKDRGVEKKSASSDDISPNSDKCEKSKDAEKKCALSDDISLNSGNSIEEKPERNGEAEKLVSHDDETSKSPISIEEEPRMEYLLASVGRDRQVHIWRAGTDGRMQTFFNISGNGKNRRRDNHHESWISMHWANPTTLLTSTPGGELLAWSLPRPNDVKKQYKTIHHEHSFILNVIGPQQILTQYNWRSNDDLYVWSYGQEGSLHCFNVNAEKLRLSFSVITASILCFSSASLDPSRLAVGLTDGSLRVWNLSLPHLKTITMTRYHNKIHGRVTALAWHPLKEMVLAYGTDEGRVGFIEILRNKTTVFANYFHTQIHKLEWGPLDDDREKLGLYALADGNLVIFNMKDPNNEPTKLDLIKYHIFKFAWKPDYSLLLLNLKDGSILVLRRDLKTVTTLYVVDKGVNSLVWHPDCGAGDALNVVRGCWFALTTARGVLVYDCKPLEKGEIPENLMDNVVVNLEGHLRNPVALAWSPFDGNKIISTSSDGLAHVWDVVAKTAVHTIVDPYFNHNPTVIWSPVHADMVIVGDKFLKVWNITKHPPKIDEDFINKRKTELKSIKFDSDKTDKSDKTCKKIAKNCIVPQLYASNDENLDLIVDNMRKLMLNGEEGWTRSDKKDSVNLFGGQEQILDLLESNYNTHKSENKHKFCELISLWKGNIADCVKDAIRENRVTPMIISLAPMVSPKLWQEACEVYARKLFEKSTSDPLEIAMYFLASHKVHEAVNSLVDNTLYREALALAKCRLSHDEELIDKIVQKWVSHCISDGNFETAAYCYIALKKYEEAAKILGRRNQPELLKFAVELAEKIGNKELATSLNFKLNDSLVKHENLEENSHVETGNTEEQVEKPLPSRLELLLSMAKKTQGDSSSVTSNNEVSSSENEKLEDTRECLKSIDVEKSVKDCAVQSQEPSIDPPCSTEGDILRN